MDTQIPTLADCQHDAIILAEMLEGIDLMGNEGGVFDGPRIAVTIVALERAKALANALDKLERRSVK